MKKFLLTAIAVISTLITFSQSSIYHPIPESGIIWREGSGGYQSGFCADYQHFITGDTIFNGIHYSALRMTGIKYVETPSGHCTQIPMSTINWYDGAFRNDSMNKKVYYVSNFTADTLIYDFNLELNDTLPSTYLYDPWYGISYVSQIDSVFISDSYHKRFGIAGENSTEIYLYLIEGIGSTAGILGSMNRPFESGSELYCVIINDQTVYPDTNYLCDLVNSMPGVEKPVRTTLQPNPVNDYSLLRMEGFTGKTELFLYNSTGTEMERILIRQTETPLNFNDYAQGLYFCIIRNESKILKTLKLIVAH